jgi:hypothetical protein
MKTLIAILAAVAVIAFDVSAQSVSGPITGSPITISSNYFLPGATTTNIPTAAANMIPVGRKGVGFFLKVGATNAASTTNATIILEGTVNGTDWLDAPTFTLSVPQNGTSPYRWYTNIQDTAANLHGIRWLRVKSIQNTNVLGIFLTNFTFAVRE